MGLCSVLLFLLGLAMTIVCIIALTGTKVLGDFELESVSALMWFGVFLGVFLAIIALLAAIGFFSLNRCLMAIVVIAFAIIILLHIICFSLAFSYKDDFNNLCADAWDAADNETRAYIEDQFSCCGGSDINDKPASKRCLGESSSSDSDVNETIADTASLSSSVVGCVQLLSDFMTVQLYAIGACVLAVTILELAVVVVTIILMCMAGKSNEAYQRVDHFKP